VYDCIIYVLYNILVYCDVSSGHLPNVVIKWVAFLLRIWQGEGSRIQIHFRRMIVTKISVVFLSRSEKVLSTYLRLDDNDFFPQPLIFLFTNNSTVRRSVV